MYFNHPKETTGSSGYLPGTSNFFFMPLPVIKYQAKTFEALT
jgi:hypothetical protein